MAKNRYWSVSKMRKAVPVPRTGKQLSISAHFPNSKFDAGHKSQFSKQLVTIKLDVFKTFRESCGSLSIRLV
jgi:hypothetical protein